ncbi:ribosomal rRNA methyltransferase [Trypanosoma rangeli]|uniref:Putative tRNA (cytidine(32)/guanosine(34)-2'-O)-methyltransferase n=1 Tax=Trypanosoma rangeli TaxID=5698 RepID=A0A422NPF8_TRYRA|nr:ribosomal rRNA methyltransferase [Trypanosoma rangeli]RNF07362.1 ribosomal rRNA methyltransferase [Trypanosoma rangeli]|eukprot:RNF07362.1 ribosomal rRNA methyltransferase [Trypanosoma rangeli]
MQSAVCVSQVGGYRAEMGRASKDKRDIYYRKAKEEGYRARSAYKLLQLHEEFDILHRDKICTGVVDLCAAPGSWSQVLARHLREDVRETTGQPSAGAARIVAVDLQEMMPIEGVKLLQGDITSEVTAREIIRLLNGNDEVEGEAAGAATEEGAGSTVCGCEKKADLVVCDGAPDVTGMHELDEYLQHHLLLAALNITTFVLRRGGTFVTKMFRGPNTPFLVAKSEVFFRHVMIAKPKSSRNASMEAFMVCQDYQPPAAYRPSFDRPLTTTTRCFTPAAPPPPALTLQQREVQQETTEQHAYETFMMDSVIVPFLACGDLSGYDADMCYDREADAPVLPPVHPPVQAPYLTTGGANNDGGCGETHSCGTSALKRQRPE